jgi:hypothetical protein
MLLRRCQFVLRRFRGYAALVDRDADERGCLGAERYYGQPFDRRRAFIQPRARSWGMCHACSHGINLDDMAWENDGPADVLLCESCYAAVRPQLIAGGAVDRSMIR